MLIKTTRFGEIEITEDKIILFPSGMIGFENYKKYILFEHLRNQKSEENINQPETQKTKNKAPEKSEDNQESSCFIWLQSLELANLAFLLIDPFSFCPSYDFSLSEKDVKELQIENAADILVLTTVSLPKDAPQNMTSNLLAPIIINSKKQLGKQIVLSENNYSITENILERLQSLKVKEEKAVVNAAP